MLSRIPLFSSLNNEELEKLKEISILKKYAKDEFLFLEGEQPKWLNVLLKGSVKIYKTSPKGKEVFLHELRPITLIAELANFENIPYPASCVFLTNSEILKIDYEKFSDIFLSDSKICLKLLKSLSEKLKTMNDAFNQAFVLNSEEKLARFIVENFDVFLTIKQSQTANILNIAPETLSRVLSKFKKQNMLIFDENGKIISFDDRLREIYEI